MKLIAISGWKRSGKDTVADYLVKEYGAERIGFADPLKDMVSELFGVSRAQIDDPATKEKPLLHMPVETRDQFSANNNGFLAREFRLSNGESHVGKIYTAYDVHFEPSLTKIEEINQGIGQLYWTPRALCIHIGSVMRSVDPDFWVKQALEKMENGKMYVISDLRYKNELFTLRKHIPDLIDVRINRFDSCESTDPSERDLDDYEFSHTIPNKGSLEELYKNVDLIF